MKKRITIATLFIFIVSGCLIAQDNNISLLNNNAKLNVININVVDYGATPNSFSNSVVAISKAIEAASKNENSVIIFPKGRYDIWSEGATNKEYFISNTSTNEECPTKLKQ